MKNMMMIGNAHIDPVWLWQWQEGYQEIRATFRSALDRLNENGDFVFTCACAAYYRWIEEIDPEMFSEIRARVQEGRWAIVGGMWIQPDMNAPSGESLARQLLYSQRYFKEKFGVVARVGYNVDSFGHNAMVPQLLRRAGMDSYVWMRPQRMENADIPEGAMHWDAPDGSRVTAYRIEGEYVCFDNVPEKIERLFAFSERVGVPVMCFYGVGNHGGGPTKRNLKQIDAYRANEPRGDEVVYASPMDYFRALDGRTLPVWQGELQHHASGCYSTHSRTKRLHRQTESALDSAERLGVLAGILAKRAPGNMNQAWIDLMNNEFHDVMGGCCLRAALEDAEMLYGEAISIAARETNAAAQRISWQVDTSKGLEIARSKEEGFLWSAEGRATPVVVFNPHAFEATGTVRICRPIRSASDDSGAMVPVQNVRAGRTNGADRFDGIFRATVPPLGYRLYWISMAEPEAPAKSELRITDCSVENAFLRAEFDPRTGAMTHLIQKKTGIDALSAPARARLIDIEHCDTWAHGIFRFDRSAGAFSEADTKILETGPVRAVLRVRTRFALSVLEQKYILYADSDRLEVETRLDFHEKHRMLKLCFPTPYARDVSEIPYGAIERTANGEEQPCQRWIAMQGANAGLAAINDGKYSYSAENGELRLTIANSSLYADHYGQKFRDDECEFMDQGEQRFRYALYPYSGSWRESDVDRAAEALNQGFEWVVETYHTGPLGGAYSAIRCNDAHVRIGAIKRAEDGRGHVLRLSETAGSARTAKLQWLNREIPVTLAPCELKTLYVPDEEAEPVREILITEIE